jgi:hypothetical protein
MEGRTMTMHLAPLRQRAESSDREDQQQGEQGQEG